MLMRDIQRSPIVKEEMYVPHSVYTKIIGRCGECLRDICRTSMAKVSVESGDRVESKHPRKIEISGTKAQVNLAKKLIEDKIKEDEEMQRTFNEIEAKLLVMKEYQWDKVSIMAHSMSSIFGFLFSALYPDKVDLFIGIDLLKPRYRQPSTEIGIMQYKFDKFLIANERNREIAYKEPPSFTYEEMKEKLYQGSGESIDKDKLHHILDRNITKSSQYPDKYYFSRDDRVKLYVEFVATPEYSKELARRIKAPFLSIKGGASEFFIEDHYDEVLEALKTNNPNFETFILTEGTHHLHLNNADKICDVINGFIMKHRPMEKELMSRAKL